MMALASSPTLTLVVFGGVCLAVKWGVIDPCTNRCRQIYRNCVQGGAPATSARPPVASPISTTPRDSERVQNVARRRVVSAPAPAPMPAPAAPLSEVSVSIKMPDSAPAPAVVPNQEPGVEPVAAPVPAPAREESVVVSVVPAPITETLAPRSRMQDILQSIIQQRFSAVSQQDVEDFASFQGKVTQCISDCMAQIQRIEPASIFGREDAARNQVGTMIQAHVRSNFQPQIQEGLQSIRLEAQSFIEELNRSTHTQIARMLERVHALRGSTGSNGEIDRAYRAKPNGEEFNALLREYQSYGGEWFDPHANKTRDGQYVVAEGSEIDRLQKQREKASFQKNESVRKINEFWTAYLAE